MSPWRIGEIFCIHLAGAFRVVDFGSRAPGPLSLRKVTQMAVGFRYTVGLPAVDPADGVTTRELSISRDGDLTTESYSPAAPTVQVDFLEGVHAVLILTDIDQSGNRSLPGDPLTFDVSDTVPPHQPGALAVQSVEQIEIP